MDCLYILPSGSGKPIKVVIENAPLETKIKRYRKTPQQVLKDELKYNYKLRQQLTRQQIHSEYGKLRSSSWGEVINFVLKRGVTALELNQKLMEIHEDHQVTIKTQIFTNQKLGIYELSQ